MARTINYTNTSCGNCDKEIDVARLLDINFCDSDCRAQYHRKENKRLQLAKAVKILGSMLGITNETVKMLGDKAIMSAMKHNGFTWSARHKNFKDSTNNLHGQIAMFDNTPDYKEAYSLLNSLIDKYLGQDGKYDEPEQVIAGLEAIQENIILSHL
jgi:hypothetical protein